MLTRLRKFWSHLIIRQAAVAFAIAITVTYSISYASLQYVDTHNFGGNSDILIYMGIAMGNSGEAEVFREARILTIWLVKVLPDPPGFMFSVGRVVDSEWLLRVKFAAVNSGFLVGAAVCMWFYARRSGFSLWESYLVMILFLTSLTVVYQGAIPLVDPSSFFFIALGVLALSARKVWFMAGILAIGLFAKESVWLLVPLAIVTVESRRTIWAASTVMASLPYISWRIFMGTDEPMGLGHLDPTHMRDAISILPQYFRFNVAIEVLFVFGFLWAFSFYALAAGKLNSRMKRQYIWVAGVLLMAVVLASGLGRTLFLTFPVIIPSAVIGIRCLVGSMNGNHRVAP